MPNIKPGRYGVVGIGIIKVPLWYIRDEWDTQCQILRPVVTSKSFLPKVSTGYDYLNLTFIRKFSKKEKAMIMEALLGG